jgi:hypothetical protein
MTEESSPAVCLRQAQTPSASWRATGSRECAPDDRLREAIMPQRKERVDCFVACAPRNDVAYRPFCARTHPARRTYSIAQGCCVDGATGDRRSWSALRSPRPQHTCHAQIARRANMSHAKALVSSGKSRAPFRTSRRLEEGRFAIVTNVGSGMRWTRPCVRRTRRSRTVKACGPDAPTLAPSFRGKRFLRKRRGQKSPVPGEHETHRENHCAGNAG